MDYESVRTFAATWGLVALVILFLAAVAYALWPRNRAKFRDAARIPLKED
ncbi:MAG: cbb3-type cytochrome c oxidase subunit 3 [Alphaproteobacteria bacterium]|nr:cbb3-type cytochrome c oxidase subunit 3 [Alphaproteobacteria bacterium]